MNVPYMSFYSSYGLKDEKYEHEHLQANASDPGQVFIDFLCVIMLCFLIYYLTS